MPLPLFYQITNDEVKNLTVLCLLHCSALFVIIRVRSKIFSLTAIARLGSRPSVTVLRLIAYSDCCIAPFIACECGFLVYFSI